MELRGLNELCLHMVADWLTDISFFSMPFFCIVMEAEMYQYWILIFMYGVPTLYQILINAGSMPVAEKIGLHSMILIKKH